MLDVGWARSRAVAPNVGFGKLSRHGGHSVGCRWLGPRYDVAMTKDEALQILSDAEVVPCLTMDVGTAKEVLAATLDADIPAVLEREECCGRHGGGCSPKVILCVREEDVQRLMHLMRTRWQALMEREGTLAGEGGEAGAVPESEEPPCPACGTAAPLVDGACSECGLQLG